MQNSAEHIQGLLSVVGTPIGNLQDVSKRSVATLAASDQILCEDTRVTAKLLNHFDIHVPLVRADENTLVKKVADILDNLASGAHISFVSDAGMPGISDPGQILVDRALDSDIKVEVIPGPSAVICALVASGFEIDSFFFGGFLPRKKGAQKKSLEDFSNIPGALVFYESPRRVLDTLENMQEIFGGRSVALVRELTKLHEEVLRGSFSDLIEELKSRGELKGECVLVVSAPTQEELLMRKTNFQNIEMSLEEAIAKELESGTSATFAAKKLAKLYGMRKQDVYERIVSLK